MMIAYFWYILKKSYYSNTSIQAYQEFKDVKSEITTTYVQLIVYLVIEKFKKFHKYCRIYLLNLTINIQINGQDFSGIVDSDFNFAITIQGHSWKPE